MNRRRTRAALALALAAGATGCAGPGGSPDQPRREDTTPRALAAAALRHLDSEPSAIAPLGEAEGVSGEAVGIEMALPREVGDNAHLGVVVLPDGSVQWREDRCDRRDPRCEERRLDDGVLLRLSWEPEAPESDPGVVEVLALRRDDVVVGAYLYGPPVPQGRPDDLEVATLAQLQTIALDPDVGPTTTADLVTAGDEIDDEVWLDWYGEGNGAPSPSP